MIGTLTLRTLCEGTDICQPGSSYSSFVYTRLFDRKECRRTKPALLRFTALPHS